MIRLILLLIFAVPPILGAQEFKRGKAEKDDQKYQPIELVGYYDSKIALLKGKANDTEFLSDIMIELFDTVSLDRVSQTRFEKCYVDQLEFFPEGVKSFGKKLMIFGSGYDKEQKCNVLKYKLPDFQKSELKPAKGEELMRVPASFFSNSQARFQLVCNEKQDRLLALSAGYPLKSDSLQIDFTIFDEQLQTVKTIHQLIPSSGYRFKVLQTTIDNRGNVELLIDWFSDGKNPKHSYSLFAFPVLSDEIVEYALDIPNKSMSDIRFATINEDLIAVSGLYKNRVDEKLPEGLFFLTINREKTLIEAREMLAFSDLMKLEGLKNSPQSFDELFENIRLTTMQKSNNQAISILLEQQSSEEICQTDFRSNMMVCSQHYYINNAVLLTISNVGLVSKSHLIEKKQHLIETDRVYLSCHLHESKTATGVLYNLNVKDKGEAKFNFPENSKLVSNFEGVPVKSFENEVPVQIECGAISNNRFLYMIGDGREGTALIRISY
jgi:hypothetical protein